MVCWARCFHLPSAVPAWPGIFWHGGRERRRCVKLCVSKVHAISDKHSSRSFLASRALSYHTLLCVCLVELLRFPITARSALRLCFVSGSLHPYLQPSATKQ